MRLRRLFNIEQAALALATAPARQGGCSIHLTPSCNLEGGSAAPSSDAELAPKAHWF
jgi:hypothetical protein